MSTSTGAFGWRRGWAILVGLFAAFVFVDAIMMVINELPKRSFDPSPEHWWSEFSVAFGLVVLIGCATFLGALRLWKSAPRR